MSATYELPYPVSANKYWRSPTIQGRTRVLISQEGRAYRNKVWGAVHAQGKARFLPSKELLVRIRLYVPDRRRRDLDNTFKVMFDALTHVGVWEDDSQIGAIVAVRLAKNDKYPDGRAFIEIEEHSHDI